MNTGKLAILGLAGVLALVPAASAQVRPYIGYAYPAGGQQGTTVRIKLGGQGLDGVNGVQISGTGVKARVVEYYRRLNNRDVALLREQMNVLRRSSSAEDAAARKLRDRIQMRLAEYVNRPACAALSSLAFAEVTLAPDAEPGPRELTLVTPRGISNPLVFHIGQVPEVSRKAMNISQYQLLGKEEAALRRRPESEIEDRVTLPCTLNGQIASGEVNRYRFSARQGQRLVISVQARQLVPYIADAVPGWFQPVVTLYDAAGKEVAYSDDYRFKPDPAIMYQVPRDGEYVLAITDALYRGREDFVYRLTVGELPFLTHLFPLGARVGTTPGIQMKGWNLEKATLVPPAPQSAPGTQAVVARVAGLVSNPLPFVRDNLPECLDQEPNDDPAHANEVQLPVIVNGRIDRPDDWDVFQFKGRAGDTVVAEVTARRLDSPLDSVLKITDASGKVLAFNDDHEDLEAGANTHHADSYLSFQLPADGTYFVHIGDTARHGGDEYGYRLRLSAPQPDFALFVMPTSVTLRGKAGTTITVHAVRKEGFTGPITLRLKNPPSGISAATVTIAANQSVGRLQVRAASADAEQPVYRLLIEGYARVGERDLIRPARPCEDRMQAFLWRHLVPAEHLNALVFDPTTAPAPRRAKRAVPAPVTLPANAKFTQQQIGFLLRQLAVLREEGLITESFYQKKIADAQSGR